MANIPFPHKLVLNRYMLGLFGAETFEQLANRLKDESLEGRNEEGLSRFHLEIAALLPKDSPITADDLRQYDENISRHTNRINRKRSIRIEWKYFQYLALLFAEVYLDAFFRDVDGLLERLNAFLDDFNEGLLERGTKKDRLEPFKKDGLRKLAFWNATGSGKTLLMHVNILQYQHYLAKAGRRHELNRVVVLTPNERLTEQHLKEFHAAGMPAAPFDKDRSGSSTSLLTGQIIDVIDMNKLREEGKKKTVSVDQFETNNLVLIDEGHRGASGDVWSQMRQRLARDGFTFEYSATLGQAAAGSKDLTDEYAKAILFDYSYRYFYADGFGKDFAILNIDDESGTAKGQEHRRLYLTAGLLSYYQQLRLYEERQADYKAFLIEKPLLVFVGGKVTAVRTVNKRKVSDVVDILLFIAEFIKDKAHTLSHIETLLSGNTGLLDAKNHDIFREAFPFLQKSDLTPEAIYTDILARLFNSTTDGLLHVEHLKGGDGELALRLGDNEPFGIVSVGDAKGVADLCEPHAQLQVTERDFSGSYFGAISDEASPINILIGSKKFTEGWNSYRVSTMGLMHIGKSEGSEIIQLFGRGVRLKGYGNCLKRSRAINWISREDGLEWVPKDRDLPLLETLNVFGVQSDYMAQFNEFLEEEGIPSPDNMERFEVPVTVKLPATPLITVQVPGNINFKKQTKTTLRLPEGGLSAKDRVVLDWYPRVQIKGSKGVKFSRHTVAPNEEKLKEGHLAFLDYDHIYFEIQRLKAERNWHNLNIGRDTIRELLETPDWYVLQIPAEQMEFTSFSRVHEWQEIAIALLKKYCDRFYKAEKAAFEAPHREYRQIDPSDPNFFDAYKFAIHQDEDLIIQKIKALKEEVEKGTLRDFDLGGIGESLAFDRHLYQPLLHLKKGVDANLVKVSPVHLNEGERDFVADLRAYYATNPAILADREVYLLRNQTRGRGVGFFEAGNFYPDFILWIVGGPIQHIVFVDPKGILRCEGLDDPKIKFHETIKDIEAHMRRQGIALADEVSLDSFIVSNTALADVRWWKGGTEVTPADFAERHVLFQEECKDIYVEMLFAKVLAATPSAA